jgi:hypothetical protein
MRQTAPVGWAVEGAPAWCQSVKELGVMESNLRKIIRSAHNSEKREPEFRLPDGSVIFVRRPPIEEFDELYSLTTSEITPNIASFELVKAVYLHNSDTFWGVYYIKADAPDEARFIGHYCFLHLNDLGRDAIESGKFNPVEPKLEHLVGEGEKPTVVYIWAIVAKKVARVATPLVAKALGKERYGGVPIYTSAATLGGLATIKSYGFVNVRPAKEGLGDLFRLDGDATAPVA